MTYVDGYVIPVKHDNKDAYFELAEKVAPIFQEHGALHIVECWGDDIHKGTTTDFFMAVKAEPDENVVFSWVVWPSKEVRDKGWEALMQDERMPPSGEMPFEGKRMFWGGFVPVVDTGA